MATEREESVFMAKLSEEAQRYDDMVQYMRKIAMMNVETTAEERNLLSVAYKNVIGTRRTAWRIIHSVSQKEENKVHLAKIKEYQAKIEGELRQISDAITKLLTENLIPSSKSGASKVFYYKMKGDYHRYVAEFSVDDAKKQAAQLSLEAYKAAGDIAEAELLTTDPIRLGCPAPRGQQPGRGRLRMARLGRERSATIHAVRVNAPRRPLARHQPPGD